MKKWKMLAAASIAMAMGNAANAAIAVDRDTTYGELFLVVWDSVGTQSDPSLPPDAWPTYVQDLGINLLTQDWTKGLSGIAVGANYASAFANSDPANLVYALVGGVRSPSGTAAGSVFGDIFFSADPTLNVTTVGMSVANDFTANMNNLNAITNAQQTGSTFTANLATNASTGAGSIGDPSSSVFDGNLQAGSAPITTSGAVGQQLGFFQIGYGANPGSQANIKNALGSFSFNGASLSYAPIPLPAGLWLLGSALLGLVGVSRRRREQFAH